MERPSLIRQFKMESGESREEVIFVDIEAWGKQGETIAKYCTKGRPLYVEGRLRLDQWEDKNTKEKRSRMLCDCASGLDQRDHQRRRSSHQEAPGRRQHFLLLRLA